MIEIYAITTDPAPPLAELPELHAVTSAGLAAVCGPARETRPSPEDLWAREDVIEKLMQHADVLPVRYGTRVPDEAAAAQALAERSERFSTALERVRGAVELALRVHATAATDAPVRPSAGGAAYMQAKADAAGERARAESTIHGPLSDLSRAAASLTTPLTSGPEVLRSAYLVDRAAVDGFAERVAQLQADNPQWRLLCTGPWPPYSFVDQ